MQLTTVGTVLLATTATVLSAVIIIFIRYAIRRWSMVDRKNELNWLKVDCMIISLKSLPMTKEFEDVFDKNFRRMLVDRNFIEDTKE